MKATLLAVLVALTAVTLSNAADSECLYRKSHGLTKHWPNPTDCGRFFRCTNRDVKREVICPADKEYNSKAGKCAPKGRGYCKLSLAQPLAGITTLTTPKRNCNWYR